MPLAYALLSPIARRLAILTTLHAHQVLGVPEKNVLLLDYEDSQLTSYPFAQVRRLLDSLAAQPRRFADERDSGPPMCTGQGIDDCGHQAVPAADRYELVAVPALRNEALSGLGRSGLPPRPPGTAHATHTTPRICIARDTAHVLMAAAIRAHRLRADSLWR